MVSMVILFVALQLINVVLQTLKSIITIKGTTTQAALMNAVAYGVYTIIVVFTAGEFTGDYTTDLIIKIIVTMLTNLVGVYISAWIMNKLRKDRLWEIVATIDTEESIYAPVLVEENLKDHKINYNMWATKKATEYIFHIYSKSQKESLIIKQILNEWNAKYFIHEESVKL